MISISKHLQRRQEEQAKQTDRRKVDRLWLSNVAIRECSSTGVRDESKLSIVTKAERGKPVYPLSEKPEQAKPQGTLLDMQVKESGESKGYPVMG